MQLDQEAAFSCLKNSQTHVTTGTKRQHQPAAWYLRTFDLHCLQEVVRPQWQEQALVIYSFCGYHPDSVELKPGDGFAHTEEGEGKKKKFT
jgi:hypothetical protein